MSIRNTMAAAEQRKRPTLPEGFVGEISFSAFIDQNSLETLSGFNTVATGTSQINTGSNAWLKFNIGGKELYVAKKPIRAAVNGEKLQSIGVIDGAKIITFAGKQYKMRLLTGTDNISDNPPAPNTAPGGEWDSILVRVHESHPAATRWASYSSADLGMFNANGSNGVVCICQGKYVSANGITTGRFCRGYPDPVRGVWYLPYGDVGNGNYGWRPVLERI